MRLRHLFLATLLALGAATAAQANYIDDNATLSAACSNYTMTFQGHAFLAGETVTITWTITLVQGSTALPIVDSFTYTSDGTTDPVITVTRPWGSQLCGTYSMLNGGSDGRYDWSTSTGHSSASAWLIVNSGASLTCNCRTIVEECRGPGFWGQHSGTEGRDPQNFAEQVLATSGPISICGQLLDGSRLNSQSSIEEALCVDGDEDGNVRLARQLAATALNCIMSGGGSACDGVSIQSTFASCNAACTAGTDAAAIDSCVSSLSCWNRGGSMTSTGKCKIGTCNGDGVTACTDDDECRRGSRGHDDHRDCDNDDADYVKRPGGRCVRPSGNCADQPLVNAALGLNFTDASSCSSGRACHEAKRNRCTIFECAASNRDHDGRGGCH